MKKNLTICIALATALQFMNAQSYSIKTYNEPYVNIEDYNSIYLETLGDNSWTNRFELDFDFPFFDQSYDHINADFGSTFYFDDSGQFDMHLFNFP